MKNYAVSCAEMRAFDCATIKGGVSECELVERAAMALFNACEYIGKTTVIFCGGGNNGADGYALAKILQEKKCEYCVFMLQKPNATAQYFLGFLDSDKIVQAAYPEGIMPMIAYHFGGYDNIIDCIFGTGLARDVQGFIAYIVSCINQSGSFVLSADMPSGICADSGQVMGCAVKASKTLAFGYAKFGHYLGDAKDYCGQLEIESIGIVAQDESSLCVVAESRIIDKVLPPRKANCHKGDFGTISIVGGSQKYIGAPILSVVGQAALRSGAGVCRLCMPIDIAKTLDCYEINCIYQLMPAFEGKLAFCQTQLEDITQTSQVVCFGMGADRGGQLGQVLKYLISHSKKLLIDADGLFALSQKVDMLNDRQGEIVLTPHPKEFARLLGIDVKEVLADPVTYAQNFAKKYGVVLLLKGSASVVSDGTNTCICDFGDPSMAKGGTGDVLSGIIGALMSKNSGLNACIGGCAVLGRLYNNILQDRAQYSIIPTDLIGKKI